MPTIDQILSLIAQYGYLLVFFGVMLESAGIPLPGETILLAAGVMVQQGHLNLGDAIICGILGAVIGDQIGYWVGREGGHPFVLRWGRYVLVTPERLAGAERFFAHHGGKAVFLARFVAGLRGVGVRYKPDALANLLLLQRPGGSGLGHGSGHGRIPLGR